MKGDYVKRRKVVSTAVAPRPTSRVVFYDTKPQGLLFAAPAPGMVPIDTITPILHELLTWQRKVNQRLRRFPGASQPSPLVTSTPVAPPATMPVMSSAPVPATPSTPTLYVRMKPSRQGIIYSIPDRILGRNVGVLGGNPGTTGNAAGRPIALYEPWTENDQGLWMRCANGGWVQLWDRTTGTYFAD